MIKNPLPLRPKNDQDEPKSSKPTKSLTINKDLLDCSESLEVSNSPIHTSDTKNFLANDSNQPSTTWTPSDSLYLSNLLSSELQFKPNAHYLETMHPQISISMRAILYDWMMEVCSELTLKRETFHLAVNLCDRYLSLRGDCRKGEYQLIGLTCMCLASKIEEIVIPAMNDWASTSDGGYNKMQIIATERLVLRTLDFRTTPTSVYNWTNWLMSQWDSFITFHFSCVPGNSLKDLEQYADKKKVKNAYEERMVYFKQPNQKAYRRFRETLQVLDIAVLHPGNLEFSPKVLSGGLLYLMISKFFFDSNYALLYYDGDLKAGESLEEIIELNDPFRIECISNVQELYQEFLVPAAGVTNLEEIFPAVSFFHPLLESEPSFDLPIVCKTMSKAKLESHYEDFLSYQTHNLKNLAFIEETLKTIT